LEIKEEGSSGGPNKRWKAGDMLKATCLSDNQGFGPAMAGEGIYCMMGKKQK
jgi:hypothetical protein